jgi:hypothetical protein
MRAEPEAAVLAFIDRTREQTDVLALIAELILTKDQTSSEPFVGLREALTALDIREEDARQGRAKPEEATPRKTPRKRAATTRTAKTQARA